MIQPLDMQVAYNAIPEIAKNTSVEQAGIIYRQVEEMGRSRQENLNRQEKLVEVKARPEAVFHPVEPKQEGRGNIAGNC